MDVDPGPALWCPLPHLPVVSAGRVRGSPRWNRVLNPSNDRGRTTSTHSKDVFLTATPSGPHGAEDCSHGCSAAQPVDIRSADTRPGGAKEATFAPPAAGAPNSSPHGFAALHPWLQPGSPPGLFHLPARYGKASSSNFCLNISASLRKSARTPRVILTPHPITGCGHHPNVSLCPPGNTQNVIKSNIRGSKLRKPRGVSHPRRAGDLCRPMIQRLSEQDWCEV
jgi:hypothetical protein